jgi:hypothetical protein
MIRLQIKREVDVPEEAAVEIANGLLEWLGEKGFDLTVSGGRESEAATQLGDADFRQLSEKFVEEWS